MLNTADYAACFSQVALKFPSHTYGWGPSRNCNSQRVSIAFVSFFCTILLCGFSWSVSDFQEVIDARFSIFMLGFASGNILYGGLAIWFIHWRGYNRKAVLFYVLIAFGSSIALALHSQPNFSSGTYNVVTSSVVLHKRQVIESTIDNDTLLNDTWITESPSTRPKKPQVAQGILVVESKADQNKQMREAAALNKLEPSSKLHRNLKVKQGLFMQSRSRMMLSRSLLIIWFSPLPMHAEQDSYRFPIPQ
ncbi:hypothetical protein COOONC_24987 [Cooperia oncophora]